MADNVGLPLTGSGDTTATAATEDIGGVHYQRVKIISGSAGSTVAATLTSTTVDANLTSQGSTKVVGIVEGCPHSSGQITRSTVNTSAEASLAAANAGRHYITITNCATAVTLWVGMSTAAVSTAGANAHFLVPALTSFTLGGQLGNMPRYTGPLRGRINSTTVAGPVIVVEFTS